MEGTAASGRRYRREGRVPDLESVISFMGHHLYYLFVGREDLVRSTETDGGGRRKDPLRTTRKPRETTDPVRGSRTEGLWAQHH